MTKKKSTNFISLIDGKKTYITSILLAAYSVIKAFSIFEITAEQDIAILGLLGAALGVSIKHAISKK